MPSESTLHVVNSIFNNRFSLISLSETLVSISLTGILALCKVCIRNLLVLSDGEGEEVCTKQSNRWKLGKKLFNSFENYNSNYFSAYFQMLTIFSE